jgi:hypothetical protein
MKDAMKETQADGIVVACWLFPYLLLSWAYMTLTDGGRPEFLFGLAALLTVRFGFGCLDASSRALKWHLFHEKVTVQRRLAFFRQHSFPPRHYAHDDISNYLAHIELPEYPDRLASLAKQLQFELDCSEGFGPIIGQRMYVAVEQALELYSPRVKAPILGHDWPDQTPAVK